MQSYLRKEKKGAQLGDESLSTALVDIRGSSIEH